MDLAIIENTAIAVSRLSFGTGSLHHLFRSTTQQNLLGCAGYSGITHFDTSPYYGYGLAETALGVYLRGKRHGVTVATKVGLYPWGGASTHATSVWARKAVGKLVPTLSLPQVNWQVDRAKASLRQSLKRLRTDYVDFLFLHEPDIDLVKTDEFSRWLESEFQSGAVRSWGVAGIAERVAPWVRSHSSLSQVVQTKDSLDGLQANFMLDSGRHLQFTYGYLSSQVATGADMRLDKVIQHALERNPTGSVVFSTRSPARIADVAKNFI